MRTLLKSKSLLVVLLAAAIAACSSDGGEGKEPEPVPGEHEGKVEATISVQLPQHSEDPVESRADGATSDPESDILTLDGLVFDENGQFIERLQATRIERGTEGKVTATLLFDKIAQKRTVHLVANSRDAATGADRLDFSALTVGAPEANVRNLVTKPVDETRMVQPQIVPPVMWGRIVLNNGIVQNTTMDGGKLLRTVASVVVSADDGTPENGLSEFEIEGASLCDPGSTGYLTPTDNVTTAPTANPTTPRPTNAYGTDPYKWPVYDSTPVLYAYERTCNASSYMSVIIKAKYKGVSGYYKILMTNAAGTPYNIVRNHRYLLKITRVTDRGYADLSTAISGKPTNNRLRATVTESSGDYSGVAADQQYMLCLTCNTFELFGANSTTATTPSVKIADIQYTGPTTPVVKTAASYPWLSNIRVVANGGKKYVINADFVKDNADHEGDLTVVADNLELPIRVKWHFNDVAVNKSTTYSVNLINAGEKNWRVYGITGQTSPIWFGLTNFSDVATSLISQSYFVTDINSKYNPGAWLHVSKGTNRTARMHKTCGDAADRPVSAEIVVVRHN